VAEIHCKFVRLEDVKKVRKSWFRAARGIGSFNAKDELKAHE